MIKQLVRVETRQQAENVIIEYYRNCGATEVQVVWKSESEIDHVVVKLPKPIDFIITELTVGE